MGVKSQAEAGADGGRRDVACARGRGCPRCVAGTRGTFEGGDFAAWRLGRFEIQLLRDEREDFSIAGVIARDWPGGTAIVHFGRGQHFGEAKLGAIRGKIERQLPGDAARGGGDDVSI